jgi:LysR family transcriptional regulator, transcriptional activator for bauABCD operon
MEYCMSLATRIFSGQISDFDLRLIRTFRAVADCGGFSLAEVELRTTKSAISKQISDLEVRLGVQLCHRGRSGFALTPEGETVYKASTRLFGEIEYFRAELNAQKRQPVGTLFIGCIDTLITSHRATIIDILTQFSRDYPKVELKLIIASGAEIDQSVASGRLQIGFSTDRGKVMGANCLPLFSEVGYLYCSDRHPLFGVDEADLTLDMLNAQRFAQHAYSEAELRGVHNTHLSPSASGQFTEGIAMLVLTGNFVGFLPQDYAQSWVEAGRMRRLMPGHVRKVTNIRMLYPDEAQSLPLVSAFVNLAKAVQGLTCDDLRDN